MNAPPTTVLVATPTCDSEIMHNITINCVVQATPISMVGGEETSLVVYTNQVSWSHTIPFLQYPLFCDTHTLQERAFRGTFGAHLTWPFSQTFIVSVSEINQM